MMSLSQCGPWREGRGYRRRYDEGAYTTEETDVYSIRIEVVENPKAYVVKAVIPGLPPENIELKATRRSLSISAEIKQPELAEGETLRVDEFHYGQLMKHIRFQQLIDDEHITAEYEYGILRITVPKAEPVEQKTIQIKVNS